MKRVILNHHSNLFKLNILILKDLLEIFIMKQCRYLINEIKIFMKKVTLLKV